MIHTLIPIFGQLIDRVLPDKKAQDKAKAELMQLMQEGKLKDLEVQQKIIVAEAESKHSLAAIWRPITMLTFVGLIVARWLGLTIEIPQEIEVQLLEIIKVGLGGYVIGRSGEKIMREFKK